MTTKAELDAAILATDGDDNLGDWFADDVLTQAEVDAGVLPSRLDSKPAIMDYYYSTQPADPNDDEVEHALHSQWGALRDAITDLINGGACDKQIVRMILASKDLDALESKVKLGQIPPG